MTKHSYSLLVGCVLLLAVVFWTFKPATKNDFVNYDDNLYITENSHLQEGLSPPAFAWAFTSVEFSNWFPLTWLSYLADYEMHGLRPGGYHLTNIAIHSLNAVLLFLLLQSLTGARWRSLLAAAVFALHPLRVESVAWIAERKDVLSTLFGLLALQMYVSQVKRRADGRGGQWFYGMSLLFFGLSLMSKPMLVTLPCLLLLLDFWPLGRIQPRESGMRKYKKLLVEKIPYFVLSAASCVTTYVVQKSGGAMELMSGMSLTARLENVPVSYCRYLGKLFWPEHLAVIYPVVNPWPVRVVAGSTVVLIVITALAFILRRSRPYLLTGWFWFVGMLVPVIGLVAIGEQSMADRYSYFPTVGVIIIATWAAADCLRTWHWGKAGALFLSLAVLATSIWLTRKNIAYWKNSETLFQHTIAVTKNNYSAYCNLGNYYRSQGKLEEGLQQFRIAAQIQPDYAENHCNLGVALAETGHLEAAIAEFSRAIKLKPNYGPAHLNLGIALEKQGLIEAAANEYATAVKLMPESAPAHNSLGVALAKRNHLDEALAEFQEAVRLDPTFAPAQGNLKMARQLESENR